MKRSVLERTLKRVRRETGCHRDSIRVAEKLPGVNENRETDMLRYGANAKSDTADAEDNSK